MSWNCFGRSILVFVHFCFHEIFLHFHTDDTKKNTTYHFSIVQNTQKNRIEKQKVNKKIQNWVTDELPVKIGFFEPNYMVFHLKMLI